MKKQNPKEHVSWRVFKKFFMYVWSDKLGDLILGRSKQKKSIEDNDALVTFMNKCRGDILILMQKRGVPTHWFQTFFNAVDKGKLDLPLHEGISLNVGDYQINNENFDEERVKKSGASAVTIKLTSQASPTQIRQFAKDNAILINRLQVLLNLPKMSYPRLDNFEEGFNAYLMKDYEGYSLNKATKILKKNTKEESLNEINKIIKRYRRYLDQNKG